MIYAIFQVIVITLVVAWSIWFAARRFFPRAYRGVLAHVADWLASSSHAYARTVAARIAPQQVASGGGCDSGGGCSSCGTCAPTAAASDVHPLVFQPRVKREG